MPIVRAVGVDWELSTEDLTLSTAMESWRSLEIVSFRRQFNQPIAGVVWPASLQRLSFGNRFNQPIAGVVGPASVQKISFRGEFNQPIAEASWPYLCVSYRSIFNQFIAGVMWPASLQQLSFGERGASPELCGRLGLGVFSWPQN